MLRLDTALYGGAIVIDRLLALLLLPLLTRAIGAADYGAWTQALAASSLLMPLVLFAFPTTIVRDYAPTARAAARPAAMRRLGRVALALFGVAALVLWGARDAASQLAWGGPGHAALVPALLLMLAGDAGVEYANAWLRAAGRIGWISAGLVLRSVLRYAVVWMLVADGTRPLAGWLPHYGAVQVALAAGLLGVAALQMRVAAAAAPAAAAPGPALTSQLAFSAPLVVLALFTTLNASLDRFLLVRLLGLDSVAVYAAAVSLAAVPAMVVSVLGFTLFPVLSRAWHAGRRDEARRLTRRALRGFMVAALPMSVAIAAAGPVLLPWLATEVYQAPRAVFIGQGVAVLAAGLYQILLYALLLEGRSGRVLALAVAAAALNGALNLILIPRWGLGGAAAAAALSNLMMVAWAWPPAWRALRTEAARE